MLQLENKHDFLKILIGLTLSISIFGCSKPEGSTESNLSTNETANSTVVMCGSDKDCKGDRICDKGECKSPEFKSVITTNSKNSDNISESNNCPSDFESFITKYRSDLDFQKQHTAKIIRIKITEPEDIKVKNVELKNTDFPVIFSEKELKQENMKQELKHENNFYTVKDYLDESDYVLLYKFKKEKNCWNLVQSETNNL